jgi:hypothetical protein
MTLCGSHNTIDLQLNEQIIGEAMQNSLMTSYHSINNGKGKNIPVGILNHLLKLKTEK